MEKDETFSPSLCSKQYLPIKNGEDKGFFRMNSSVESRSGQTERPVSGLWFDGGLYYADVRHPSMTTPIRVALHGIRNCREALEAVRALSGGMAGVAAPGE